MPNETRIFPTLVTLAAAAGLLLAAISGVASAQVQDRPRPQTEMEAGSGGKPNQKAEPGKPPEAATPGAPAPQAKRPPPPRPPQTAEEKAKTLSDLYAQLQAAEDEEAAKRIAGSIERLWAFSGSDTVNLLLQRAGKAIAEKKADLAQKLLDAAVDLAPDYTEAFNKRAFFYFTQNNYDAAVGDLRRVLALDPSHYKALEGLAQIWRETGNKKGAYRVMEQLLEVHPYASGAKQIYEELKKEVDGQGI